MAKTNRKLTNKFIQRVNPLQTKCYPHPQKKSHSKIRDPIQQWNKIKIEECSKTSNIGSSSSIIQHSSLNETLIYMVSQSSTMNPQLLFNAVWTYIRSTKLQVLDSTYTVFRLLNKSLASWTYKQNLNALDLEESLFKLFYCGIKELIQGRKRSQNRMANRSYQLVSRNNLLIIQNSSSTTPPSKRKTTLQGTIIKF